MGNQMNQRPYPTFSRILAGILCGPVGLSAWLIGITLLGNLPVRDGTPVGPLVARFGFEAIVLGWWYLATCVAFGFIASVALLAHATGDWAFPRAAVAMAIPLEVLFYYVCYVERLDSQFFVAADYSVGLGLAGAAVLLIGCMFVKLRGSSYHIGLANYRMQRSARSEIVPFTLDAVARAR